jgi:hypothetical protein
MYSNCTGLANADRTNQCLQIVLTSSVTKLKRPVFVKPESLSSLSKLVFNRIQTLLITLLVTYVKLGTYRNVWFIDCCNWSLPCFFYSWTHHFDIKDTKVVILGQDPYHGPGQAHGLCFSVQVWKLGTILISCFLQKYSFFVKQTIINIVFQHWKI